MVLDLLDGLVSRLRYKDDGEEGPGGTDCSVEPEGAAEPDGLNQVHKGLGHQKAGDEGKADDEGVGDGPNLNSEPQLKGSVTRLFTPFLFLPNCSIWALGYPNEVFRILLGFRVRYSRTDFTVSMMRRSLTTQCKAT